MIRLPLYKSIQYKVLSSRRIPNQTFWLGKSASCPSDISWTSLGDNCNIRVMVRKPSFWPLSAGIGKFPVNYLLFWTFSETTFLAETQISSLLIDDWFGIVLQNFNIANTRHIIDFPNLSMNKNKKKVEINSHSSTEYGVKHKRRAEELTKLMSAVE